MARAAFRSLRYLSRYFSFWFFRGPLFIFPLCSKELVGEGKAGAEAPEPELEMAFCCGEPRKDWAVKACRACCRSSSVCERTDGGEKDRDVFLCSLREPEACAGVASRTLDENILKCR